MSAFYNVARKTSARHRPDVGGGFGSKDLYQSGRDHLFWASKKTGVPVKWTSDRTEAFPPDAHGRDHVSKVKMALDANHRVTALKVDTTANSALHVALLGSRFRPISYATAALRQYNLPPIYANVHAATPIPHRRCLSRAGRPEPPICWNARWKAARANWACPR